MQPDLNPTELTAEEQAISELLSESGILHDANSTMLELIGGFHSAVTRVRVEQGTMGPDGNTPSADPRDLTRALATISVRIRKKHPELELHRIATTMMLLLMGGRPRRG